MVENQYQVLVVDDEPVNLNLVKEILQHDYHLSFATNGLQALEIVKIIQPDLVLLDIMMPDIDGYETCRRLKADPATEKILVIFFTALGGEEDETLGFDVGGVDFITKPAKPAIIQARVRTHLELKKARDDLIQKNRVLIENEQLRNDIDGITRHDLKGPLVGIINYPRFVLKNCPMPEKYQDFLQNTVKSAHKLLNMINLSLDLYKMEKGIYQFNPTPVDILPILNEIIEENQLLINSNNLIINARLGDNFLPEDAEFFVFGDHLLFYSMFSNVIRNAIEASPEDSKVTIICEKEDEIEIRIHNYGEVPKEIQDRFFEKYVTAGKKHGTGLGTYSAKLIAETQRGTVKFTTSKVDGTEVRFSFPNLA